MKVGQRITYLERELMLARAALHCWGGGEAECPRPTSGRTFLAKELQKFKGLMSPCSISCPV